MRYDLKFNYDYLIQIITDRYKATTLNKKIDLFCREIRYFTLYRLKMILANRCYFVSNEIYKISVVLKLSNEETIKCFFELEK